MSVSASSNKVKITLYDNTGATIVKRVASTVIQLPSMENPKGYTFMGWSKKAGETVNPDYQAGETIRVQQTTRLYAVMFNREAETDIKGSHMTRPDLTRYKKVIFVGDSRTFGMQETMRKQFDSSVTEGVTFITQNGQKLNWLKTTAAEELIRELGVQDPTSKKTTAVIFNLGVNDLRHTTTEHPECQKVIQEYVTYLNNLAITLKQRGCTLFYLSVNPFNSSMMVTPTLRSEAELLEFNKGLQTGLSKDYKFLDSYSYLMKNGYGTKNANKDGGCEDDGTHYTAKTYKRIYRFCIKNINR